MSCIIVFLNIFESVISWGFLSHVLRDSNHYINFDLRFWSSAIFEVSLFLLPKSSQHQTADQYQGSANHGELHLKSDVNWPDSGKLRQSASVYSQCERFSIPECGMFCILIIDIISKISVVLFTLLRESKNHFKRALYFSWPYCVQDNTRRIVGYFHSTVKNHEVEWLILPLFFPDIENKLSIMWYCPLTYNDNLILVCFILECHVSFFLSQTSNQWFLEIFCLNFLRQSKNYINFDFRFWSTEPTFICYLLVIR